jgi:hypothetical protein
MNPGLNRENNKKISKFSVNHIDSQIRGCSTNQIKKKEAKKKNTTYKIKLTRFENIVLFYY